jgi:hypothetical protein
MLTFCYVINIMLITDEKSVEKNLLIIAKKGSGVYENSIQRFGKL